MGLFSPNYNRPGPGVPKDAPKKKGIARFVEILARDFGNLVKVNFLYFICFLPLMLIILAVVIFTIAEAGFYLGVILPAILLATLTGMLTGPATAALHAVIVDMVRDEPAYVWHTFKDKFKKNFKQAGFLGMFFTLVFCIEAAAGYFYLVESMQSKNVILIALFLFNLILVTSVSLFAFLQEVYLDLRNFAIVKNSLLLTFGMAKRSLPATLMFMVILFCLWYFVPIPVILLLYIVIFPAVHFLIVDMWLWPVMEKTFNVSELLAQKREEHFDAMDEKDK